MSSTILLPLTGFTLSAGTPPSVASSASTVLFPQAESDHANASMLALNPGLSAASTPFQASAIFFAFSLSALPGSSTSSQNPIALLALMVLEQGDHSFVHFV
jgi:hypothetical protein